MVRTIDHYGAPSYGPLGRPVAGFVFHTPENVDPTLLQAINVARWQAGTGNTTGSYHGILGHDSAQFRDSIWTCTDPEHWVMVRTVPWDKACGGVGHTRDVGRYPWIKELVHAKAFVDPNKYFHQIAISGKAAQYNANGYPKGALIAVAQWVKLLEKAYGYDAVLTLHRHWQANRSDPGPLNFAELVLAEYRKLDVPVPVPPPAPKTYTQAEVDVLLKTANTRIFTKNEKIKTAIAMLQDALN